MMYGIQSAAVSIAVYARYLRSVVMMPSRLLFLCFLCLCLGGHRMRSRRFAEHLSDQHEARAARIGRCDLLRQTRDRAMNAPLVRPGGAFDEQSRRLRIDA